jgi:hypothetical protein
MTTRLIRLQQACDASDDVDFIGPIYRQEGWWTIPNRAGVVIGSGRTCQEACEDLLGPVEVNP